MDSAELDRWLDEDLAEDGEERVGDWEPTPDASGVPRVPLPAASRRVAGEPGRQRSWLLIGGAGVTLLAVVAALTLGGGSDAVDTTAVAEPPGATDSPADPGATVAGGGPPVDGPVGEVPVEPSDLAAVDDLAPVATELSAAVGPATAALRARLTSSDDEQTSYLEWATPVEVLELGAGVELVVLDAIWLEGPDGAGLEEVRQARWAVPIADNGEVLATPWPHSASPEQVREAADPPAGTVRVGEVEQAAIEAGWTDVTVVGSDPHPLIAGAVTAFIEGIPPGGGPHAAEVLWLHDGEGGLEVPGVSRRVPQANQKSDEVTR